MVNSLPSTIHSQLWLYVDLNLQFSIAVYRLSTRVDKKSDNCKLKNTYPSAGALLQ